MDYAGSAGLVGAVVTISFFLFITAAAVMGIIYDFRKRQLQVDALKIAVEHGERLDPVLMERLIAQHKGHPGSDPRLLPHYVQLGGIITTATGIGIALFSFFLGQIAPKALYPVLGAGVIVICVGLGLIAGARVMKRSGAFAGTTDRAA